MLQTKKIEGKIGFIVTDQSNVDPYSDFQFWETLRVTSELLKRPSLVAAHAVGKIYEVPPPPGSGAANTWISYWVCALVHLSECVFIFLRGT